MKIQKITGTVETLEACNITKETFNFQNCLQITKKTNSTFHYRILLYDQEPDYSVDNIEKWPILILDPKDHPNYYVTSIELPYLDSEQIGYVIWISFWLYI